MGIIRIRNSFLFVGCICWFKIPAALKGHSEIVGQLIKAGTDVSIKDNCGETALVSFLVLLLIGFLINC